MKKINKFIAFLSVITMLGHHTAFCDYNGTKYNEETGKWEYNWCDPKTQKTFASAQKGEFKVLTDYAPGFLTGKTGVTFKIAAGYKVANAFTYQYNREFNLNTAATAGAVNASAGIKVSDAQTLTQQVEYTLSAEENIPVESGKSKCGVGTVLMVAPVGALTGIYCLKLEWEQDPNGVWTWIRKTIGQIGAYPDGYIWEDEGKRSWGWKNTFTPSGTTKKELDYGWPWERSGYGYSLRLGNNTQFGNMRFSVKNRAPDNQTIIFDIYKSPNLWHRSLDYTVTGNLCKLEDFTVTFANGSGNQGFIGIFQGERDLRITGGKITFTFDWPTLKWIVKDGTWTYLREYEGIPVTETLTKGEYKTGLVGISEK